MPTIADLSVTVDDGKTSVVPGVNYDVILGPQATFNNDYTVTVTNNGPDTVTQFNLNFAPGAGLTWAGTINPVAFGSVGTLDPVGDVNSWLWSGLSLASGQSAFATFIYSIDPNATGPLTVTSTVIAPAGTTDPTPINDSFTDSDTVTPQSDLAVAIDDGTTIVVPGTSNTYTITVTNNGPSTVSSLTLTDSIPAALLNPNFTPSAGAYISTQVGPNTYTGVWSGLSLASGQSVTLTLTGTIDPNATGLLTNIVTVAPPAGTTDTNSANDTATDTDTIPVATTLATTASPNVTLSNSSVTLSDSATLTGGSNPTGNIVFTLSGPGGFSFTETDTVNGDGTYDASLTLPTTGTVVGTYSWTAIYTPGDANNLGSSAPTEQTVVSPVTPSLASAASPSGAFAGSTLTDVATLTGGYFPTGSIVFTLTGPNGFSFTQTDAVSSGNGTYSAATTLDPSGTIPGTYLWTAQYLPGDGNNNAVVAAQIVTVGGPQADLAVTVDDGKTTVTPGSSNTYTITVTNNGPSMVDALVTDSFPADFTNVSWFVLLNPGAISASPPGSFGDINATAELLPGGSVTFRASGQISASATGSLINTVTVAPLAGTIDPNPANDTATDTDTLVLPTDLAVTITNAATTLVPGISTTYAITVTNNGPNTVGSLILTDTIPGDLLNATFGSPSAGSYDRGSGLWSGLNLASGQSVSIALSGVIGIDTGTLTNTVTVSLPAGLTDTNPVNNVATDTDTLVLFGSPYPPAPAATSADMLLRRGDGLYAIYSLGNNASLAAHPLAQVGSEWQFAGLGRFQAGDTADMLLRNANTGGFQVYDINNNNITNTAFLGTVGIDWQVMGFGNFSSRGETDMILRNSNTGGLQVYDISNNQITGTAFMGTVGLNWQFSGVGNFSGAGESDMLLRNANTGGLQVYDITNNQLTGSAFLGAVGLDWQFSGVGNFSGVAGETDLLLRNVNTGGLQVNQQPAHRLGLPWRRGPGLAVCRRCPGARRRHVRSRFAQRQHRHIRGL